MNMTNQNELLDKIKKEILRMYPITCPRKNNEHEISVMEIYFTFGATYDNKPITAIGFLTGNETSRSSTQTHYRLTEYIKDEIIFQLISYLLSEYPDISDLSIFPTSFLIDFQYPYEREVQEGISCDKIILEFRIREKELAPLLNKYLSTILLEFPKEMSQTKTVQQKYNAYCENLKQDIISSLNDKEIDELIQKLPIEKKKELLQKLPIEYFSQFYQEHTYQEEQTLIKQLEKKFNSQN